MKKIIGVLAFALTFSLPVFAAYDESPTLAHEETAQVEGNQASDGLAETPAPIVETPAPAEEAPAQIVEAPVPAKSPGAREVATRVRPVGIDTRTSPYVLCA